MSPVQTFFSGLVLLVLFGWYLLSDADRAKRLVGTALIVLLMAFCLETVYPAFDRMDPAHPDKVLVPGKIALGLDLRGGTSFLLQLMPVGAEGAEPRPITKDAVEQAMEAIRKRIDTFGVSEPIITPAGSDRILVQIPGLNAEKIDEAREQLRKVAKLEFHLVNPQSHALLNGAVPWDPAYVRAREPMVDPKGQPVKDAKGQPVSSEIVIRKSADLTGDKVVRAGATFGPKGYEVHLDFNSEGARQFAQLTKEHVHEQFAIMLDGEVQSAPVINEEIPNGTCVISGGSMNESHARNLASALQNPLQTPVKIVYQQSVSSTLGESSIRSGVLAGVGGLALVLIFVVVYYRFAGLVAIVGLVTNIILLFGVMSMFGFVLTLPGIAGIILTIGLAVDANVLIYERLREELAAGKTLGVAITSAYDKAFTVIFDANATTLITAAILFWKATGPVKGFAVTLTVGVIASVFSAMIVTRVIFAWALGAKWFTRLTMLHIIPTGRNFNFLGKRRLWISVSVLIILISGVSFGLRWNENFGIDFKGGDLLTLSMTRDVSETAVREALVPLHLGEYSIQKATAVGQKSSMLIRSPQETADLIRDHLQQTMPDAGFQQQEKVHVGTIVGKELATTSLWAFGLGVLGILVFVTLRFEFSFAMGAIVALLHDVIITVGLFALLHHELTLIMVGAILTIAGYSINDTIVVFDRIREGLHAGRRGSVQDIMNASINETLSRTLLTSGCTFLSVAALFFFGGPTLHDFALVMMIGIIVGTYSSIFIASPIVLWWSGHKGQKLRSEVQAGSGEPPRAALPVA